MDALTCILATSGASALSGVALVYRGLRGRTLDDHPVCRRCNYDLFGAPAGAVLCSECGAALARRRAVRIGNRQRRALPLALGLLIALLGLGMIGTVGYVVARGADLNRYKPIWWLARDLRDRSPAIVDAAYAELDARSRDGRLSDDGARTIAASFTELQSDPVRRWDTRAGVLLMRLHTGQKLADDAWDAFCRAAIPWRIEVAPHVGRAEPLTLAVRALRPPAENPRGTGWGLRATLVSAEVGGVTVPLKPTSVGCINCTAGRPAGGVTADRVLELTPADRVRVLDGDVPVRCVIEFRIGDLVSSGSSASRWWTGHVTIDAMTHVTDARPPASATASGAASAANAENRERLFHALTAAADAHEARAVLSGRDLPVAVAARAYLKLGKQEWRLGEVVARPGDAPWQTSFDAWGVYALTNGADLVLRPDAALAARAGVSDAWPEDIVIRVRVPRQPPKP